MSSNSSNSSVKVGNTKQPSPRKRWCFTLNNWSQDEYDELIRFGSSNSYIIGKEIGEEGTPHLQGYFECQTKIRLTACKKINARAHWEFAKGTRNQNFDYCSKEGDYSQNLREIVYVEPVPDMFKPIVKLMNEYNFPKGDRKINVVVDRKGGTGKTEFTRWATQEFKELIVTGGKGADMKNQIINYKLNNDKCPKYIIVDVPRSSLNFISWAGIEECKNMLFYSGKYEGGMVVGNKPFFLMFMNEFPDMSVLSRDRWNIIDLDT